MTSLIAQFRQKIDQSNSKIECIYSVLRDLSKYMSADTKLSNVAARCRIINENLQRNFKCQRSQKVTIINHWLHNYEKHKENVIASCIRLEYLERGIKIKQ